MTVIVTGDRNWRCEALAESVVRRLLDRHGPDLVILHGAAKGVDQAFEAACNKLGVATIPHRAEWDDVARPGAVVHLREDGTRYAANAGPLRNQRMVDAGADVCLAFHANLKWSKGTKDCVRRALEAGIPVWLVESEDETAKPVRVTEEHLT